MVSSARLVVLVTHCEESLESLKTGRGGLQEAVDKKVGILYHYIERLQ